MKDLSFLYQSLIAHRGIYDNKNVYENSIPAFIKALKYNLPIELDIHLLKDNTIVVFHDDDLKRFLNNDRKVNSYTYLELNETIYSKLGFQVPTLLEVLNLVNGKVFLDIEIKYDSDVKKTCEELTKILDSYQGKFIIKSFGYRYIRWFYTHRPKYIRGILLNDKTYRKGKKMYIYFLNLYCRPDFYAIKRNIIKEKGIQKIRKKKPILCWTIKKQEQFQEIRKCADGLILDFSNDIEVLNQVKRNKPF